MATVLLLGLGGCTGMQPAILPDRQPTAMGVASSGSTDLPAPAVPASAPAAAAAASPSTASGAAAASPSTGTATTSQPATRLFQTPPAPQLGSSSALPSQAGTAVPEDPALTTAVSLEHLPLPVFIDTVFATILKRNVSADPAITQRKEMVSLKSGKAQTASGLYEAAKAVLKTYGIAVTEYNGLVRVTATTGSAGFLPEVRRGRSLPDVPTALRPVFQIVDLEAVTPSMVAGWLRTVFGQRLLVQDDLANQAVLVSGQSDDVAAAIDTIRVLDQPTMRGRASARIAPLFWSADEMAKRLGEIMTAQGYAVGIAAQAQAPIILLPVPPLNSVLVFARSEDVLNHVLRWATEIDRPASGRGSAGYFTYPVRNLDAAELAKTLQEVMNPPGGGTPAAGSVRSRVVVNPSSNTLIIQGSPTEYQQWFGLLQELDRPPRGALVTVTIAEVRLNAGQQLGFEWMLKEFQLGGFKVNMGTLGAFGTSAIGGLSAVISAASDNSVRAVLNALASTTKVRVLANPSVMARNGESAYIQVGQEVPIVTSQQSTGSSAGLVPGGGATLQPNVLQSIQYRSTGVILKVKPVIHAGGRIDLDVEQEVSSAAATRTGVTASPTISTRRVTTKLSVTDGATVLLGGLMQETASTADTGVPLLKDIPYAGALFRSSDDTRERTELVVLITPYVIADEFEARSISEAFQRQLTFDATVPNQSLRPERRIGGAAAPGSAIDDLRPPAKPYVLPPPASSNSTPAAPARPAASAAPSGAAPQAVVPRVDLPAAAAPKPAAPAASTSAAATAGQPVTDPLILKELQKAAPAK